MKAITVYLADDGSRWNTAVDAIKRDAMHAESILAEFPLGPRASLDAQEYVQHSAVYLEKAKCNYESLAMKYFGTLNGRVIADMDNPVSKLMYRLMAIDNLGREWNQPWGATHTPENPKEKIR